MRCAFLLALSSCCLALPTAARAEQLAPAPDAKIDKRLAKIMAANDGTTPETAYKVASVGDEYAILRILGLKVERQSLVSDKKTYDRITARDAAGTQREVWFDVGSFFGRMF